MSTINEVLSSSSVFKAIDMTDIEKISALFEKRDILPGEIIATAGESVQNFYLLVKGTALLGFEDGRSVVLNQAGDFIAMELISRKGVCRTNITALENGQMYAVPREKFLKMIQEDTVASEQIMASWQEYLNQTAPFITQFEETGLRDCF